MTDGDTDGTMPEIPRPAVERSRDSTWLDRARSPRARLGFGVALVALLATAWFASGRAHPGAHRRARPVPPTSTTTGPATRSSATAVPSPPIVSVPSWVPAALAATCRASGVSATVVVVECTPGRGVAALEYRAFASVGALRAAYAVLAPHVGGAGSSLCARGRPDERSWSAPAFPNRPLGRYRCSIADGRARLVWTSEASGVLGVAARADGDLRSLYQWWSTVPGPNAPA